MEGKAGTGKSTTLTYIRERAQEAGLTVRGFAPTTTAAGVLREGGIDATTVAAKLNEARPDRGAQARELWIVDEAGLLSTKQARELLDRAEREKGRFRRWRPRHFEGLEDDRRTCFVSALSVVE